MTPAVIGGKLQKSTSTLSRNEFILEFLKFSKAVSSQCIGNTHQGHHDKQTNIPIVFFLPPVQNYNSLVTQLIQHDGILRV